MLNKVFTKGWNVAYKNKKDKRFTVIKNNIGSWVADPFIVELNGEVYIFGEMYTYDRYKGSIAYTKLINGKFTKWKRVIIEDYHLSFPNIYIEDNQIYMYAEANLSNEFYRYKAVDFPDKWVKERVYLKNVQFVDTVLFDYNHKKYGFTYDIATNPKQLKLFELKEEKVEFLDCNPLSTDDGIARPAGKVLYKNNQNIRVSQNCIGEYGKNLVFSSFIIKDGSYNEQLIKKITVEDIKYNKGNWIGIHTYNESENFQVIDLKFKKIILSSILIRLKNKLMKGVK